VNVISYPVEYYANEILSGNPFSLIRYGEGEWRVAIPSLPHKADPAYTSKKKLRGIIDIYKQSAWIWSQPESREALRETLVQFPHHDRYWPAAWHLNVMAKARYLPEIERWLHENGLKDIPWHSGWIWRQAIESDRFHIIVKAIREQPLPVIVVAPGRMHKIKSRLDVALFVNSKMPSGPNDIDTMADKVLGFGSPALIIFSAGVAGKIALHRLFPEIGHHSFLIDFGACFDGLCGNKLWGAPRVGNLTPERIELNWEGPV